MHEKFTATTNNEVVDAKDPNRRLVAALLLQAVQDIRLKRNDKNEDNIRKAENWFNSESDSPFTFVWICQILDRDVETTRAKAFDNFQKSVRKIPEKRSENSRK